MLAAKNLEKLIALENDLKAQYQTKLDAQSAEIQAGINNEEELKSKLAKQLEQISELSVAATANKRTEQLNRELNERGKRQLEEITTQKKRLKGLQKDLAEERAEIKLLKQFDAAKMKKNLDATKKKLVEKTTATDLLQKSLNKTKTENAELRQTVAELEEKLEGLEEAAVE